ncbi:ABC-type branched-subunit amino acid transport system substrate-binding protein [Saccharothrix tamanrassetensis]|uniref:ABC-type branched-subunit amino acid transport system substrate-binding protein n=1 Tax=Saccharothrix tamanrassetensis TaxID=1051531 RepID=A0A841CR16_9PSEU|nr:ABC transporter substrate-binding protein [Saccharothrix tamanrassetensis]MBB5957936.1 ABC-type branched-subunit amino acid transport system substrate-binding protein [Saccharothrix tamanrassetensis]
MSPNVPRSPLHRYLVVGLVVVVVAVLVGVYLFARDRFERCDGRDDVRKAPNGECVGVTAADSDFDEPELTGVIDRIRAANEAARADEQFVSVAVFLPMSTSAEGIATDEWVRNQLQGSYQAQVTFNKDARPKVQLLLANPGSDMSRWPQVVAELDRRRSGPDHLVAVTGIGLSLGHAREAMRRMSELRIPMVGSTITADDLRDIPGLLRPAPTNERQARAAANHAKRTGATKALLVTDTNGKDLYPSTLASAFRAGFGDDTHRVLPREQQYDSGLGSVENAFTLMLPNICATDADLVYFAGRGRDLVRFVGRLATRLCQDRVIHILTGDDLSAEQLRGDQFRQGLDAGVEVVYTDVADERAWEADRRKPEPERRFQEAAVKRFLGDDQSPDMCFRCMFGTASLGDDGGIMAYDAMLTATTAIQRASGVPGQRVTTAEVLQTFHSLNGESSIAGASGLLSYDNDGTAHQKVVPLLKLDRSGKPEFVALVTD